MFNLSDDTLYKSKDDEIQNLVDNSDIICDNDVPCSAKLNKLYNYLNNDRTSLTHLGRLSGAPDTNYNEMSSYGGNNYGASFKQINKEKPYFHVLLKEKVIAPWLAQKQEATFMNRTKVKNEPEVKTYADLELTPISDLNYEKYEIDDHFYNNKCKNSRYNQHNKYNHHNKHIEHFESTNEDLYYDEEEEKALINVGVGFILKIMGFIIALFIIYLIFKKKDNDSKSIIDFIN